jgi:hypothetical protein
MTRSRPFGISVLAALSVVATVIAGYHTLQYLHILPFWMGSVAFFGFDLLGALLWGLTTLVWAWVAQMLWTMNPSGWLFLVILSVWNLVLALLAILGQSTFSAMLPAILVNGVLLLYCLWPRTREAFQQA